MSQENQNLHDTAALRALASGELLSAETNQSSSNSTNPTGVPKKGSAGNGGSYVSESTQSIPPATTDSPPSRNNTNGGSANSRNGAGRYANRQNYHVGIQFRKTIIPLLLVMAMVLIALGVFTLMKVNDSSPEAISRNPFLANGTLFAGVAISLGICLIAGSLFFHYEVKKHHRQNGGGKK